MAVACIASMLALSRAERDGRPRPVSSMRSFHGDLPGTVPMGPVCGIGIKAWPE
jgi:hypothetical protein